MIAKCTKRDQILSRYHNNADKGDTGTKNEETSQLYFPSLLYITNNGQRKCEYRYLCSDGSRGWARGHRAPPSPLIPLIFQTKLRPEGPRKFFLETFPPPPPRPPHYLKVWIRFYYVSFLLFTPRIKLRIKWRIMMSYVRLPIVWIVGPLATVHQLCQRKLPKECQTKLLKKFGDLNLERY